jgi:hypothetical protein
MCPLIRGNSKWRANGSGGGEKGVGENNSNPL